MIKSQCLKGVISSQIVFYSPKTSKKLQQIWNAITHLRPRENEKIF